MFGGKCEEVACQDHSSNFPFQSSGFQGIGLLDQTMEGAGKEETSKLRDGDLKSGPHGKEG